MSESVEMCEDQDVQKLRNKKRKNFVHDDEPSDKKNEVKKELSGSRQTLKSHNVRNSGDKNGEIKRAAQQAGKKAEKGSSKQKGSSKNKSEREDPQQDEEPETSKMEPTGRVLRSSMK